MVRILLSALQFGSSIFLVYVGIRSIRHGTGFSDMIAAFCLILALATLMIVLLKKIIEEDDEEDDSIQGAIKAGLKVGDQLRRSRIREREKW